MDANFAASLTEAALFSEDALSIISVVASGSRIAVVKMFLIESV
jgi:hypothetical protein